MICPIYEQKKYNLSSSTNYIDNNYPEHKYYSSYNRKTPIFNKIYRFYKFNENKSKSTISVLPAYILHRKQKSIKYFFKLVSEYANSDISIEKLHYFADTEKYFQSIKTLYRYFNCLNNQLSHIIKALFKQIIIIKPDKNFILQFPDSKDIKSKLKLMLKLLTELLKIIHEANISTVLESESPFIFIFYFL